MWRRRPSRLRSQMKAPCRTKRLPPRTRRRNEQSFETLPADQAYDQALDRALKLLTYRSRSRWEIRERLQRAGFEEEIVDKVDARLTELDLLNDQAFAREWAQLAGDGRGLAEQAIRSDLAHRGVAPQVASAATQGLATDDFGRALALARRRIHAYHDLRPAKAYRRLGSYLASKGYESELVAEVCRRVLGEPNLDENPDRVG